MVLIALESAGIPDMRLHDLRHSAASAMVNAGYSLYVVGKTLGHKHASTTQRYAHVRDDVARAASDGIVTFLRGAKA